MTSARKAAPSIRELEARLFGMPAVSSMIRKVACMSGDPGGEGAGSAEMDQLPRGWYGKQVLKVQRPRIHGLVVGQIDLLDWAGMKTHLQGLPTKEQVIACVVRMLNGVLGQRGQLLNEVSPETVALRLNGFVAEFSMWLPPISTSGSDAGLSYAGVITRTLSRLSYGEVREYFPLFAVSRNTVEIGDQAAMVPLPLSAPAPVPRPGRASPAILIAKDVCEMMLCSTKQKKRKGVPYCGTCRKFMEETVKWYFDLFRRHPAKEKDKFVQAVRTKRYGCKQNRGVQDSCDCKACHSLRRFQEMYPKCESNLHEFKRRSFLFNDDDAETSSAAASSTGREKAGTGRRRSSGDAGRVGAYEKGKGRIGSGRKATSSRKMNAIGIEGSLLPQVESMAFPRSDKRRRFEQHSWPAIHPNTVNAGLPIHLYGNPSDPVPAPSVVSAATTLVGTSQSNESERQSEVVMPQSIHLGRNLAEQDTSSPSQQSLHQPALGAQPAAAAAAAAAAATDYPAFAQRPGASTELLGNVHDLPQPDLGLLDFASPQPAPTPVLSDTFMDDLFDIWKCPQCASWNHPEHSACERCYFSRQSMGSAIQGTNSDL